MQTDTLLAVAKRREGSKYAGSKILIFLDLLRQKKEVEPNKMHQDIIARTATSESQNVFVNSFIFSNQCKIEQLVSLHQYRQIFKTEKP